MSAAVRRLACWVCVAVVCAAGLYVVVLVAAKIAAGVG